MSTTPPSPYSGPLPTPPQSGLSSTTILLIVLGVLFVAMLACGGVLVALLLPAVGAARQAARQAQSQSHLKQIGLALHSYHDVYDSFPPAYTTDANGNPLLSWRVAILPFIEEGPLYDRFDLDQPWDSEANRALAQMMPTTYRSPTHGKEGSDRTHYVAMRSPQSVFPGAEAIKMQDITDGLSSTIAVAELPNGSVVWTMPDDCTPADFVAEFRAANAGGVTVALSDGSVKRVSAGTTTSDLEAMITRDGGESSPVH